MSFEKRATLAYKKAHADLSRVLYEFDPMGAAGGGTAPEDEYDSEATQLMNRLKNAESAGDAEREIALMFGPEKVPGSDPVSSGFATDAWAVWSRFQQELEGIRFDE